MYKLLLIVAFAIFTSLGVSTGITKFDKSIYEGDTLKVLEPKPEHASEAFVITNLLKQYHYRKLPLSDSISSVIFNNYFEALDPGRAYFFQSDIDKFEHLRYQLDDQIPEGELNFAYHVFEVYRERALNRIEYVFGLLDEGFDFAKDENYEFDRENVKWPTTEEERNDIWRKIIKNSAITYKLSGSDWEKIVESLTKRYQRIRKAIYQYNSEDVFQNYMNAYTNAYDPHTTYFSPPEAENFQIEMGLSLEGIGARLMQNLDYTQVSDVIVGGPAYKGKELEKDDRIIGVAQGDDGEFVDVIGWRLDDVVAKIRGPKGSVVRLQILKASEGVNALPDTIRIVRDKIKLEEQAAKADLIPITEGNSTYKLGVITIPSFYLSFDELNSGVKDYRSTTRDVKKLITDLETQGMDGLLIDLRYNGGGALQEAIEMTGLFIPDGPVVQVRNTDQSVDKMQDKDGGDVFYDGPLAVMVNRGSASASEIFSGAIQDYKRGVIIGESTFGKGTVQNIIDLDRYIRNPELNLGQLKMTLAKFYRVTGSSNQLIGISPDVHFPSLHDAEKYGEASRSNALPWDEIANAGFQKMENVDDKLLDKLNAIYLSDLSSDPDLQKLVEDIEKEKKLREETSVSLNFDERKAKADATKNENLSASVEDGEVKTEITEEEKKLKEDPYLKEGLKLLAEITKRKIG